MALEKRLYFEGKYFVFDWFASYDDSGGGMAVFKVINGELEEGFHPFNLSEGMGYFNYKKEAVDYLKEQKVYSCYTPKFCAESDKCFLGMTLHRQEELTDLDFVPGQVSFESYNPLNPEDIKLLRKNGITVEVIDITSYLTD